MRSRIAQGNPGAILAHAAGVGLAAGLGVGLGLAGGELRRVAAACAVVFCVAGVPMLQPARATVAARPQATAASRA
jgi:hypothetical protein